jgi:hypothetical protein
LQPQKNNVKYLLLLNYFHINLLFILYNNIIIKFLKNKNGIST